MPETLEALWGYIIEPERLFWKCERAALVVIIAAAAIWGVLSVGQRLLVPDPPPQPPAISQQMVATMAMLDHSLDGYQSHMAGYAQAARAKLAPQAWAMACNTEAKAYNLLASTAPARVLMAAGLPKREPPC